MLTYTVRLVADIALCALAGATFGAVLALFAGGACALALSIVALLAR